MKLVKLMKHCVQCGELKKRGFMKDYNYYRPEEVPNNYCPEHNRILHDVYLDSKGEVHTLDRWDIAVFRAIIGDVISEIDALQTHIAGLMVRVDQLEVKKE